jgi:hypothetical protein
VSATHVHGELTAGGRCLIVHGTAQEVTYGHPLHAGYGEYAHRLYGLPYDPDRARDPTPADFTGFIQPRRIYAQGFERERIQGTRSVTGDAEGAV